MLRVLLLFIFAAISISTAFAAGQTGAPRYLVKVWIQKFDKSFEHATGWCGSENVCALRVGAHEVGLHFFLTGDSYRLRVYTDPSDPSPCCTFADEMDEAFISGGNPHAEVLYYRRPVKLSGNGRVEFGTIYIALEDLR